MNFASSGVKQYFVCSGATEISNFNVARIHFSLFWIGDERFSSCKNLNKSSSLSLSGSCLKKLDTVRVTGGKVSRRLPISTAEEELSIVVKPLEEVQDDRLSF